MADSDDFSPDDVFKLFPTAFPPPKAVVPPETTTAATIAPTTALQNVDFFFGINGTFIFSEQTDSVVLPLLLGLLGICSLVGNCFIVFVIVGFSRMRNGPNLMLLNVTVADMVFMVLCVPTAIINHVTPGGVNSLPGTDGCKFVHYMIFVTVYVAIYSLVVTCVFQFFASRNSTQPRNRNPLLSRGNAFITSLVIWTAFILCHLNFLVQREGAVFQEPFICLHSYVLPEPAKIKTLWVTFLTCAFLVPLVTICSLSAAILHGLKKRSKLVASLSRAQKLAAQQKSIRGVGPSTQQQYEAAQNELNEQRSAREVTLTLMASMIVRSICWLPIQIFVMVDAFGMIEITETYRKAQMLGVCFAFAGTCISPLLYHTLCRDFKNAFSDTCRKIGCTCCASGRPEDDRQSEMNETILSIISDSSNHINYS